MDEWSSKISIQTSIDVQRVKKILERRLLGSTEEFEDEGVDAGIKYRAEEYEALTVKFLQELDSHDFYKRS